MPVKTTAPPSKEIRVSISPSHSHAIANATTGISGDILLHRIRDYGVGFSPTPAFRIGYKASFFILHEMPLRRVLVVAKCYSPRLEINFYASTEFSRTSGYNPIVYFVFNGSIR